MAKRGTAVGIARRDDAGAVARWAGAGLAVLALAGWAVAARAQDAGVTVSHAITTFGDPPKYPADFPHLDYVNPDAPKGGEISQWAFGGFDSLNPYSVEGRSAALASAPYESTLTTTSDEIGASYCLLCETMEYPEDRSWVIFNLRQDVKFSDGTPMTAEDVLFSYELFRDKGIPEYRSVANAKFQSVEVLDPYRIKFTFTPFLGTGQYVLDKVDVGKSVTYRRDADYWGADLPINRGRGNFDTIRYEYYGDYDAAFEGFKGGDYTFRNEASSITWATRYDFPALANGWVKKEEIPKWRQGLGSGLPVQPPPREVPGPACARGDRPDVQLRMVERHAVLRALHPDQLGLGKLMARGRGRALARRGRLAATACG